MAGVVVAKVYGSYGKPLEEANEPSFFDDWSMVDEWHVIFCSNSDLTGTNEFALVTIIANDVTDALYELDAQCVDGLFKNSAVGDVTVVDAYDCTDDEALDYVREKAPLFIGEELASKIY